MTVTVLTQKKKLRSYSFEFKGVTLTATVVIIAYTKADAQKTAIKWAIENKIEPETIFYNGFTDISETPVIVFQWNGDY